MNLVMQQELFTERIKALSHPLVPLPTNVSPHLRPLSGIRAVLFDIYGTCVVSGSGDIGLASPYSKPESLLETLAEQGLRLPPEDAAPLWAEFEACIARCHRERNAEGIMYPEVRILDVWQEWKQETGLPVDVPRLAIDLECRVNPVWPMPGVPAVFHALREWNLELGVVSNAQVFTPCIFPALLGSSLETFGIPSASCVWSWAHQQAKPGTALYDCAAAAMRDQFGIEPEQCLMVGNDMKNDIAAAAAVGMKTALFAGDARSLRMRETDPMCDGLEADVIVTELMQLVEVIVP